MAKKKQPSAETLKGAETEPKKHKSKKRNTIIAAVAIIIIICVSCSRCGGSNDGTAKSTPTVQTETPTETKIPEETESPDEAEAPAETETPQEAESLTATELPAETATTTTVTESYSETAHQKEIDAISGPYSVRDDAVGTTRLATTTSATPTHEYALDYYNAFMDDNSGLDYIWNATLGTVTSVQMSGGWIFVHTTEYVEDEEHSAKTLGAGMTLGNWMIDPATGEIESLD